MDGYELALLRKQLSDHHIDNKVARRHTLEIVEELKYPLYLIAINLLAIIVTLWVKL